MIHPWISWRRLSPRGSAGLACDKDGVALGPVTLVARQEGRYRPRPDRELAETFTLAYGPPSYETFLHWHDGLARIAKALDEGKPALAAISAVQLGLPAIAPERMEKLARSSLAKDFNPDEPRVPGGEEGGGEWTGDGGGEGEKDEDGEKPTGEQVAQAPSEDDEKTLGRARAIYGETAGLRPALLNTNDSPNDSANWDPNSAEELERARMYVGIISERNHNVWSDEPSDPNNPIQAQAWNLSLDAAKKGADPSQLDGQIQNFFMRQVGIGDQTPRGKSWENLKPYFSLGPFYSVGGGDVRRGPAAYIDFYGKK